MNKIILLSFLAVLLLPSVFAVKCYWETNSPNIEFGYTEVVGYGSAFDSGTKYYPITDYISVKKVLLRNEYVGSYFNHDLNVTTIKVRTKEQNSNSYMNDLELFNKNNCSLIYMRCLYGDCKSSDAKNELYSYYILKNTGKTCWNINIFGSVSRVCLPKFEWQPHNDTLDGWKKIIDDAGINATKKEIRDCIKTDCLNLTGRD